MPIYGHGVDTINMATPELSHEWLRKHSFQLDRIKGTGIFPSSFEGMDFGVEVSRKLRNIGPGLLDGCSRQRFDFLPLD